MTDMNLDTITTSEIFKRLTRYHTMKLAIEIGMYDRPVVFQDEGIIGKMEAELNRRTGSAHLPPSAPADVVEEFERAWAATGVEGAVRGLTTLDDVVACHRRDLLEAHARIRELEAIVGNVATAIRAHKGQD